ncbi:type I-E CRISPR-associated protein Cse2/CasB [Methanomethylovorans sp.]|uniref:type I-E CRISPR-associated protein Cse2/CasB n=1 Tax=Methanomethylovorans sp. TaxID=2758717 RepID=UPI00351C96BE
MATKSNSLDKNPEACDVLLAWWRDLDNNRGDRAALRRCHNTVDIVFNPAYHKLWLTLNKLGFGNRDSVALIAGVLANVKNHQGGEAFATQMASMKDGSTPLVSGLRFKRLLKIKDKEELFSSIVRIVKLMDGSVNACNLANGLYWWNDYTKKEWAYSYYEKASESKH